MGADSPQLPSYRKPPLEEVALAIQLQPAAFDFLQVARLYDAVKSDLPERVEQPSRPPMSEDFASPTPAIPFSIEVLSMNPMPRFWFMSESHTRLLQVQHDFIAYNWRRSPDPGSAAETYPRYSALRSEFEKYLARLNEILGGTEDLSPTWCEVTYINHIAGSVDRPRLSEVLRGVAARSSKDFLPEPEDAQLGARYRISLDGTPRGRLNVSLAPAVRLVDSVPIWTLTLTSRIAPADGTMESAMKTLDLGREWVVRGFDELTSEEMHVVWEKEESA